MNAEEVARLLWRISQKGNNWYCNMCPWSLWAFFITCLLIYTCPSPREWSEFLKFSASLAHGMQRKKRLLVLCLVWKVYHGLNRINRWLIELWKQLKLREHNLLTFFIFTRAKCFFQVDIGRTMIFNIIWINWIISSYVKGYFVKVLQCNRTLQHTYKKKLPVSFGWPLDVVSSSVFADHCFCCPPYYRVCIALLRSWYTCSRRRW